MRRKKILILPTLRDRKGDTSKKWYVELSQRNPKTDEMCRRRFECHNEINLNELLTAEERYRLAELLINDLTAKLSAGWTIFNDTERYVYEDQLQYHHQASVYKKQVKSNSNIVYWLNLYIVEELRRKGLSSETLATYESRFRVFRNWIDAKEYGWLDVTSIDNAKIVDFFLYLRNERKQSGRTYRSYRENLQPFFDYLIKIKVITQNPVYDIPDNYRYKDMGAERIHPKDVEKLISLMDREDKQLALACRFEYYCGMRPGYEIRLMKVGDIDFRREYSKVKVTYDRAKMSKRREVPIPDVFLEYLVSEWKLNECSKEYYLFGQNGTPGLKPIGKNNMRARFCKIREKLGMPEFYKFYSFKHTGAVTLAEQGETTINIRDHLGHTSIQTTESYLKRHGISSSKIIRHNFPKI